MTINENIRINHVDRVLLVIKVEMTVCQGCGRSCNTDLCCPACASMERSSFFCSQDCFSTNWKEHCKLHAIIKQQLRMLELDNTEKKQRGLSAANDAFSVISELFRPPITESSIPSPDKVSVESIKDDSASFKDHRLRPIDKVIGPNGLLRGFRVVLVISACIFFVFVRINSMISEIPVVVEKRTVIKVSEALGLQQKENSNTGVLVSDAKSSPVQTPHETIGSELVKGAVHHVGSELTSAAGLRNEIEKLRKQVEKYKGLYEAVTAQQNATSVNGTAGSLYSLQQKTANIGFVHEDIESPRLLREVGVVGLPPR